MSGSRAKRSSLKSKDSLRRKKSQRRKVNQTRRRKIKVIKVKERLKRKIRKERRSNKCIQRRNNNKWRRSYFEKRWFIILRSFAHFSCFCWCRTVISWSSRRYSLRR
jgi:hypothetical protein